VPMMEAAAKAAVDTARAARKPKPLLIGVTVLTSMTDEALKEIGITTPMLDQVVRLATLAKTSGLDGVVASPQEVRAIRNACGAGFEIVTPGIRPAALQGTLQQGKDDQARTMTPAEAIDAGATYLVIGRPITGAPDPKSAAEQILATLR